MERSEEASPGRWGVLRARWLGRIAYRDALVIQRALAYARADGLLDEDQLLLLEHEPVITLGRNADAGHVLAPPALLAARGIEVVRVERGGEVTYHGPGQLVAYPIVALAAVGARAAARSPGSAPTQPDRHPPQLGVRPFVEALEGAMADLGATFGVPVGPRPGHPGAWVDATHPLPRKIGALGIRVARGVSFHGVAFNVSTNLADFDLIDPCGMPGLRSTSLAREHARPGGTRPGPGADRGTPSVAEAAAVFASALAGRLERALRGLLPPDADPAAERLALEGLLADVARPVGSDRASVGVA